MESMHVRCERCGRTNRVPAAAKGSPHCANCHAPLPWIVDAGDQDFAVVAEAATVPVLVDLWAPWCGPCRTVSPVLERIARDRAGQLKLVKVNVDASPSVARRFAVQGIPTLLLVKDGEVVARQVGAAPANVLQEWLDQAISKVEVPSSRKG